MTNTSAAAVSTLLCLTALTLTDARAATYGGIALGRANIDTGMRPVPVTGSIFGPPDTLTVDDMSIDDHDTAYAAFFGVQITRYFGAEVGYWNHGTFQSRTTSTDTGELEVKEIYLGASFRYPFANRFALTGGLGLSRAEFTVHGAGAARVTPVSLPIVLPVPIPETLDVPYVAPNDETGTYWNAGVNVRLTQTLEASFSYGIRDLKVERVKLPSISLLYAF